MCRLENWDEKESRINWCYHKELPIWQNGFHNRASSKRADSLTSHNIFSNKPGAWVKWSHCLHFRNRVVD
jgi:hypothetical protein